MKKILAMVFMLSSISYSEIATNMEVKATVMETLTVRTDKDVDFGKLAKGTSNNTAYGLYSVKGQGGESVNITIGGIVDNRIPMKHISGATIYATVDRINDTIVCVQDTFVQADRLNFNLSIPDNATTGEYVGEVLIKARYM